MYDLSVFSYSIIVAFCPLSSYTFLRNHTNSCFQNTHIFASPPPPAVTIITITSLPLSTPLEYGSTHISEIVLFFDLPYLLSITYIASPVIGSLVASHPTVGYCICSLVYRNPSLGIVSLLSHFLIAYHHRSQCAPSYYYSMLIYRNTHPFFPRGPTTTSLSHFMLSCIDHPHIPLSSPSTVTPQFIDRLTIPHPYRNL